MKKYAIIVRDSCDEVFVERTARKDPFDYWNRCIAPGTKRDEFDLDKVARSFRVSIGKEKDTHYNRRYVYTTHDTDVVEAIIMRFGIENCEIYTD